MGSAETERPLGEVFDSVAEDYDLVRQGYPAVLVDAAVARGRLVARSCVLEVGCGTGKLTELLAARELIVDAVDPGPKMVEQAKRRVGGNKDVRFHIGRFEDVALSAVRPRDQALMPEAPSRGEGGGLLLRE